MITRKQIVGINGKRRGANIFGKELYVVLLADGRDFVYLILMFIRLIFRQSSINE